MHPDTQEKLFQEIRSVVPLQDDDVTKEDLNNMPYLDAFLKEAFRFFPVVPVLTRIIKKDIQIGSYPFAFHRNSDFSIFGRFSCFFIGFRWRYNTRRHRSDHGYLGNASEQSQLEVRCNQIQSGEFLPGKCGSKKYICLCSIQCRSKSLHW